jgi:GNAT superfamily N-acetyltransferase
MVQLHPAEMHVEDGRRSERCVYLYQGHVTTSMRRRGIGAALVEQGMAWARAESYTACNVDEFTANPLSGRFWSRRGFVPFAFRLEHRVNPRAAPGNV